MIFDCHTHWGICWEDRDGQDPAAWLAGLDHHGIDKALLMSHRGLTRCDLGAADNDLLANVAAQTGGQAIPIGTVWPQLGDEALAEMQRCVRDLNMPGMKFHPWLQGFSVHSPEFEPFCDLAADLDVPLIFHDGTPCYSMAEQIHGLARRFPKTKFVLGHAGLLWNWRSALPVAERDNVWLCLCGPHQRAVEIICERCRHDRILWGSDYGFGLTDLIRYRLTLIREARIDKGLLDLILSENALELLG